NLAPATVMSLGTNAYTACQINAILQNVDPANGYVILAHHLIAAKLNGVTGPVIDCADAFIGSNLVPPVGGSTTKASNARGLAGKIDAVNNCHDNDRSCP